MYGKHEFFSFAIVTESDGREHLVHSNYENMKELQAATEQAEQEYADLGDVFGTDDVVESKPTFRIPATGVISIKTSIDEVGQMLDGALDVLVMIGNSPNFSSTLGELATAVWNTAKGIPVVREGKKSYLVENPEQFALLVVRDNENDHRHVVFTKQCSLEACFSDPDVVDENFEPLIFIPFNANELGIDKTALQLLKVLGNDLCYTDTLTKIFSTVWDAAGGNDEWEAAQDQSEPKPPEGWFETQEEHDEKVFRARNLEP